MDNSTATPPTFPNPNPAANSLEPSPGTNEGEIKKTLIPKPNRAWIIVVAVVGSLLLITIVALATAIIALNTRPATPPPEPPQTLAPPASLPVIPSKYATDAGVLDVRDKLKNLMEKTGSVDLIEPEIAPPNLDLNLQIQPQQ